MAGSRGRGRQPAQTREGPVDVRLESHPSLTSPAQARYTHFAGAALECTAECVQEILRPGKGRYTWADLVIPFR